MKVQKRLFDIGDVCNMVLSLIANGTYKKYMDATCGDTKEDGFRGALCLMPSLIMGTCQTVTVEYDMPPVGQVEKKDAKG